MISSASTMWENTGPGRNLNCFSPVAGSVKMTSVPVMSLGIRSGVNWMRLKESWSVLARVEMSSVLARPGTPMSSA